MDSSTPLLKTWQVHPAKQRVGTAVLSAVVIGLAAWLAWGLMDQIAWGLFAVVVMVTGCNRYFFPTRYELDAEGITARFPLKTTRYQWAELRRFVYDDTGGFLSPRARRSFLDEYRGISLLFSDDAEPIIAEISRRLPEGAVVRKIGSSKSLPEKERTPCGG